MAATSSLCVLPRVLTPLNGGSPPHVVDGIPSNGEVSKDLLTVARSAESFATLLWFACDDIDSILALALDVFQQTTAHKIQ